MSWTIPDKSDISAPGNVYQSTLQSEDIRILVAGISHTEAVVSGCAVTAQGTPDMTVAVAAGATVHASSGTAKTVAAGNVTIGAADSTYARIDSICISSAGSKVNRAGSPDVLPIPGSPSAGDCVIAHVYVPANQTTIPSALIVDKRVFARHPVQVYRQSTVYSYNGTTAATDILNNSAAGFYVPRGLLAVGQSLHFRMGGNYLNNSGFNRTLRFNILINAANACNDISGNLTTSANRRAWFLEFWITRQGTSDESVFGNSHMGTTGAPTNPTNGYGEIYNNSALIGTFTGAGSANFDSAEQPIQVVTTFNGNDATLEMVCEYATVELI